MHPGRAGAAFFPNNCMTLIKTHTQISDRYAEPKKQLIIKPASTNSRGIRGSADIQQSDKL